MNSTNRGVAAFVCAFSFLAATASVAQIKLISPDEMAEVLAVIVVADKGDCAISTGNEPIEAIAARRGHSIMDFSPDGRFSDKMNSSIEKAVTILKLKGKKDGCAILKNSLMKILPEYK